MLCGVYFICLLYGGRAGRFLQAALFVLLVALLPDNSVIGARFGKGYREVVEALEKDVRAGASLSLLAECHGPHFLHQLAKDEARCKSAATECLRLLHRAGVGPCRSVRQAELAYDQVSLSPVPTALRRMAWQDGRGLGNGAGSWLTLGLQRPRRVYAVRVRYAYEGTASLVRSLRLSWKDSSRNGSSDPEHSRQVLVAPEVQTVTVWVNDTIDQLRIQPDKNPFVFRLSEITLLVPASETGAKPCHPGKPRGRRGG